MFPDAYTRALKVHDRDLFAARNYEGVVCVFRKVRRENFVGEIEPGVRVYEMVSGKQFVFAVTDTWSLNGRPRGWGIDRVVDKLKSIDAQANDAMFDEMDRQNDKVDESSKRHMRNEMEAFWSHERRRFAKATDDILTHSLSKNETKKRLKDRRIK